MSHKIFLTPACALPSSITQLAGQCKSNLLTYLYVRVCEEILRPSSDNETFTSKHPNWIPSPEPKITSYSTLGVERLLFEGTNYALQLTEGSIEFTTAVMDTVKASYYYFPFTDLQISNICWCSLHEISVLIYRTIDENNIHQDYRVAICKRLYTNLLKALLLEARDYFSVSVGGRTISKTNIVAQLNVIIEQNESQLWEEINALRHFNKTNKMLPTFPVSETLDSNAEIS